MGALRGFALLEVVLACCILAISVGGLFWMTGQANRSSMDANFEFLALNLAREPLDAFRGFGYDWLQEYEKHPLPAFPLGWSPIVDSDLGMVLHPAECSEFLRYISLHPVEEQGTRAIRVHVEVTPAGQSQAMAWFMRRGVSLETLVVEKPL